MNEGSSPRILVTGFRSFPRVPDNPSQVLIETLGAATGLLPPGAQCRLLDTAYAAVAPELEGMLPPSSVGQAPTVLVMTGYSALAEGFKLERRASSICSPRFADAEGFYPPRTASAATDLRDNTRCDFAGLQAELSAGGLACHLSDDAGEYVCNHAYHAALRRIASLGLPTRAVFVHVPAICGTPLERTSASAMPLVEMARGVALIARVLADR